MTMPHLPAEDRYDGMPYRRAGRSGLLLPAISLGLWQNFGAGRPSGTQRDIVLGAFDRGVTQFDLANNYGPPAGAAERFFGGVLASDLRAHRDELVIATKAGWRMWPGPYGDLGSRKYLLASLDASLSRLGVDYVDIFYSHRPDPDTPLEETAAALDAAVRSGKALYVGISSYSPSRTARMAELLQALGTPLLVHQPSYSLLNRWVEHELLDTLEAKGVGCVAFSPLAQGLLTGKYLDGVPEDSRLRTGQEFDPGWLSEENLQNVRALDTLARRRGQTLAQLAISWILRDTRVTSVVLGASSVRQLDENLAALDHLDFDERDLQEIDAYAQDGGLDLWRQASSM